jgi:hypothetical protein
MLVDIFSGEGAAATFQITHVILASSKVVHYTRTLIP